MVAVVVAGAPPVGVTVDGLNEQVPPVGRPEHAKPTGALKLLTGVTVIVAVPLAPVNRLRLVVGVLAVKSGGVFKATAKLLTSSEPSPVAKSKPVPAEKPMTPVDGHCIDVGWTVGVPASQATLLSLPVTSWNAEGAVAASWYSEGLMLPSPVLPMYWFMIATMPAKSGAETDVPPTIEKLLSTA
jgi:hypothetical protein